MGNDDLVRLCRRFQNKPINELFWNLRLKTKPINFNFKITHRILAIGEKLKKWNIKDTDKCQTCGETETIEHFLVQCPDTVKFWQYLFTWWEGISQLRLPVLVYEIIFSIPNDSNEIMITIFNFILLTANYYVYCNKKKGKKLHLYEFLLECKKRVTYESKIYEYRHNKEKEKVMSELKNIMMME